MKPELTQSELAEFSAAGKTAIWQYNTLYRINFSDGEYRLRKILQRPQKGMGVTRPGRFVAMTPTAANRYI